MKKESNGKPGRPSERRSRRQPGIPADEGGYCGAEVGYQSRHLLAFDTAGGHNKVGLVYPWAKQSSTLAACGVVGKDTQREVVTEPKFQTACPTRLYSLHYELPPPILK